MNKQNFKHYKAKLATQRTEQVETANTTEQVPASYTRE